MNDLWLTIKIGFSYLGFFGTGNIASISSFELSSTYRFLTVFNPFVMAALLILKVILPFFGVAAVFGLVHHLQRTKKRTFTNENHLTKAGFGKNPISTPSSLASIFLGIVLSDISALHFFFLVRDEGSWKDIGTSIGHFALCNAFIIFALVLYMVSDYLVESWRVLSFSKILENENKNDSSLQNSDD